MTRLGCIALGAQTERGLGTSFRRHGLWDRLSHKQ